VNNNLPWVNNSIRHIIRLRDNPYRRGQTQRFKHYRQKVKTAIQKSKSKYCSTITNLSSRENWQRIKSVLNLRRKSFNCTTITAEDLLDFFTSIKSSEQPHLLSDFTHNPEYHVSLTYEEVFDALSSIHKGGGVPFVPGWIIRDFKDIFLQPLKSIFEANLRLG